MGDELATLIATDPNITAPGDASHAILFAREELLAPGQVATLDSIEVTLLESKRERLAIEDEIDFGHYGHWLVRFRLRNVSDAVIYGVHPSVHSQMQYQAGGVMVWEPSRTEDCSPSIEEVIDRGLQPGGQVTCTLVYLVPVDGSDLYWVYAPLVIREDHQEVYAPYQVFPP
jgi:hypothetical protein